MFASLQTDRTIMATKKPQPEAVEFQVDLEADVFADEATSSSFLARLSAEVIGTFIFIFIGLGVTLFSSVLMQNPAGIIMNALAWGIALFALIVAVGRVSGAHFNPAVTVGAWVSGRFPGRDVAPYVVAQMVGAITAGALVWWLAGGMSTVLSGYGLTTGDAMSYISIGSGVNSPMQVDLAHGLVVEFIAASLLIGIILASTSVKAPKGQAAVTIGLSFGILVALATPFTNGALNPARATATALFAKTSDPAVGNWAVGTLWQWALITLIAGAFVGLLFRAFGPEEDLEAAGQADSDD